MMKDHEYFNRSQNVIEDLERWRRMTKNHERGQNIVIMKDLKDDERSWKAIKDKKNIMKNDEIPWKIAKDEERSWKMKKDYKTLWNILKYDESSRKIVKDHETS